VLIAGAAIILAAGAAQYYSDKQNAPPPEDGTCAPEGGLRCDDANLQICIQGKLQTAGACPGGCKEDAGVARCLDTRGFLIAPEGAGCRQGMGLCGITPNTLLVCQNGALKKAADCPAGCTDEGENGGLYCLDNRDSLRFAEGFACPRFDAPRAFACGGDGRTLLTCKDGLLAKHTTKCDACFQGRRGDVTCFDAEGTRLDPDGGGKLLQ